MRTGTSSRAAVAGVRALTLVAAGSLVACGSDSSSGQIVTEQVRHQEVANALAAADLQVAAGDYVRSYNDELGLGLSPNDEYSLVSVRTSAGLRHARLQQTYAGVPVFGGEVVVHADETTFLGFNGMVTKHLDGFDTTTAIGADEAFRIARQDHSGDSIQYTEEASRLVILPRKDRGADLAWHVELYNARQGDYESAKWNYFVEARTGEVLKSFNNLHTAALQGSGPGGNAKKARTWSSELDVEEDAGEYKMETDRLRTVDRGDGDMVIKMPDLENMEDEIANDAHGYAEITLNMMRDWMGRNSLDDAGFVIVSRVHDVDYCPGAPENACWNGAEMTYGDGGSIFYPLGGALDVVGHELNHGFTTFHSNLTYAEESGGLNESFSDIAGTIAEFFDEGGSADFDIGEDIFRADGALRYMCDPTGDGASIEDAGDFTDGLDPHYSSGVPNRAFCLAVARYKAGPAGSTTVDAVRRVGSIWYEANASYWTAGSTYVDGCQGTVDAARALGFAGEVVEGIAQSWADVGVECEGAAFVCNDDGTCDAEGGETCASCSEDCGACSQECGFWKKAKCKVGIGDCSRCDAPPGCGDGLCDGDEDDESCAQDCGCSAAGVNCGSVAPFGCYCDNLCEDYGDCCADVSAVCE